MFKKILTTAILSIILILTFNFSQTHAQAPSENLDSAGFMYDVGSITHEGILGSVQQKWMREGINYVFKRIIQVLAAVIGGLSILVMAFGGFLILSSAGSDTQYQKGVNYIKYSAIGLAFTLGAYILVLGVQLIINSIYG